MIKGEISRENILSLEVKGDFEEVIAEVGIILKHIIEAARQKGASEEYLTTVLCALQNYALGNIPEK